jgi:hypothetical protein
MRLLTRKNKPLSDQSNRQGWRELARYSRSILTAMVPDTRADATMSVNESNLCPDARIPAVICRCCKYKTLAISKNSPIVSSKK